MKIDHPGLRWSAAVLATAAIGGVLASCGGDDGGSDPSSLQVTASGDRAELSLEVDAAELPSGATEIELVNDSKAEIDGQLVYTADERSDDEVIAELGKAMEGEPVAEWFEAGGGPGATHPGESSTVTQELQAETYYVVGSSGGPPSTPLARIEVTDDGDAELPEADETVEAVDYSYSGELTAGPKSLLLENNGEQWHHFLAARLLDGSTIEDARRFFETEEVRRPSKRVRTRAARCRARFSRAVRPRSWTPTSSQAPTRSTASYPTRRAARHTSWRECSPRSR